jgi:hypothetical protein
MNFIAYSDESYSTAERYRSIATFSFPEENHRQIREELTAILEGSKVSEFKWHRLKDAKYRFCAIKLIQAVVGFIGKYNARIDVLIWDTHDSRHRISQRDDLANFGRMFFHLHSQALRRRPRNTIWKIYPDKRIDIDWASVRDCLRAVGGKVEVIELPLLNEFFLDQYYHIEKFNEVESQDHPCCQVADLFAGLAVFSKTHYRLYKEWAKKRMPSLGLFQESSLTTTNREENRFDVLKYLNECCKEKKLGVSLDTFSCLFTPNPQRPINFWHYKPQHDQDKAPTKIGK